jgi:hypothetical protein
MLYPKRIIKTENSKHRLHNLLSTFITTLACVQTAFTFRAGGKTDWPPGTYMAFECRQFDAELRLPNGGVVETLIQSIPVNSIEIGILEKSFNFHEAGEGETLLRLGKNFTNIETKLITPFFVEFFEDYRPWIDANLSRDFTKWPNDWQFGRIVRNAAAHNAVSINDQKFVPVNWYGLSYGPAQHGRPIFDSDMGLADIVILMIEMNDSLDKLGAPIEPPPSA